MRNESLDTNRRSSAAVITIGAQTSRDDGRTMKHQAERQQALADYSTAIAKSKPPLTPTQRELAGTRINFLSH
jgi:hypothetical protein